MADPRADIPFTLRGHRGVAARRRAQLRVVSRQPGLKDADKPAGRRDELAESLAAAEEIAEILAAQAGDDVAYFRHQATQIVGFMINSGWVISRRSGD